MTAPSTLPAQTTEPRSTVRCADLLGAVRRLHANSPIFVERKRDFLNLYTESDAVAASMAGHVVEYEIKVSRSDFSRDRHKKRNRIYSGEISGLVPNRFFYVTPEGIITESDLPTWAGWYEMDAAGKLQLRKKAPRLKKDSHGIAVLMKLSRAMRFRT